MANERVAAGLMSSRRFLRPPADVTSTSSTLFAIAHHGRPLEPEEAEWLRELASELSPRRKLLQDRNAAIVAYAEKHLAHLASDRAKADAIAEGLIRETSMKSSPEPGSQRAELRAILDLNAGEPLGSEMIRTILASRG